MRGIDADTRIAIVGMTGTVGQRFMRRMLDEGSPLVAGINPKKAGSSLDGVPVVAGAAEAVALGANAALVVVPAAHTLQAVRDAAAAGVGLISVYTEGVPLHDALRMAAVCRDAGATLFGPNSAGVAVPAVANLSDLAPTLLRPGSVGIVSKSGTLTYEVLVGLQQHGLGCSAVYCLGGDPVVGTGMADIVSFLAADDGTDCVVAIGEIGGEAEYDAARAWAELDPGKPLVTYVAGLSAPPGKQMGHAGAILSGSRDDARSKQDAFAAVGALPAYYVTDVAARAAGALGMERPRAASDIA